LYAHMNNKRKMKKKVSSYIKAQLGKKSASRLSSLTVSSIQFLESV